MLKIPFIYNHAASLCVFAPTLVFASMLAPAAKRALTTAGVPVSLASMRAVSPNYGVIYK